MITGKDIHAAWRDGMLAQGRPVPTERMSWETLSEPDKQLDDLIALRLHVQGSSEGDTGMTVDPEAFLKMTKVYYENLATIRVLQASLHDVAGVAVPNVHPRLCEKSTEEGECIDADTTLGCQHEGGHKFDICSTHDEEWSECPFRPYSDRIAALQKRMAWRAIYTFTRRVDEEWIVPALGRHYSAHPDGTPYVYDAPDGIHPVTKDDSPSALYPAVVVPKELIGRVIVIRPVEFGEGERL